MERRLSRRKVAAAGAVVAAAAALLRAVVPSPMPDEAARPRTSEEAGPADRPAGVPQSDAGPPAATPPAAPGSPPVDALGVAFVRPGRGTINFPDAPIEIRFTRPMERHTVEAAFAVEPPVAGALEWPSPAHLRFTPARPFPLGSEVTVRLGPGMREAGGTGSLAPFAFTFPVVARYSFAANVGPWLRRACRDCHGPDGVAKAVPLAAYGDVAPLIVPGRAGDSRLIAALDNPTHRAALPAPVLARKAILATWIERFHASP